ncbi:MAG: hypothetical protein PW788_05455 [Micavibrio sp.]|nr:hypothetical protein [Micavibrio sp.]
MSDANIQTTLSETLNRLSQKNLSTADAAEDRRALAAMATGFNDASLPVAEKLASALGDIGDYGARWITAKMLRDAGLKDEQQGTIAMDAYTRELKTEKDVGSRYMFSGLARDIGVKFEALSVPAATAIAATLATEKDGYARNIEKNALMALANSSEAAAPVAIAALGAALLNEPDKFMRQMLSGNLADIGVNYASQAGAALAALAKGAEQEKDGSTVRRYAQDIALIAINAPDVVPQAIRVLSNGMNNGGNNEATVGYSNALRAIGEQHPMAVIVAAQTSLDLGGSKDQRRLHISNLKGLAALGHAESTAVAGVLAHTLAVEKEAFNRRLAVEGLMACITNRIDEAPVKQALQSALTTERDRETRDDITRSLRSLGIVVPYAGNALRLQPTFG